LETDLLGAAQSGDTSITQHAPAKAVELHTKAAGQGYTYAQFNLALCYEKAWGVAQDKVKAVEWFTRQGKTKKRQCCFSLVLVLVECRSAQR
jgi:TPR repeat protein